MQRDNKAKRLLPVSWWKLALGIALLTVGIIALFVYINNERNMGAGALAVFTITPGGFLVYLSFKSGESGFSFAGKRKHTGNENAIILFARRDKETNRDTPVILKFVELTNPPKGARLHYVRNLKRHYYELFNNPVTKKLEPVGLPDKKSFPPELFQIPAAMQVYKDAIDYSPPTMLQKIAPGILLLAMVIVGLLMVMTGG